MFINGKRLEQGFITAAGVPPGQASFPALKLDEAGYSIMGDNRTHSADSRFYGPIPLRLIAGRASAVIWPPRRGGRVNWRLLRPPEAFAALTPQL